MAQELTFADFLLIRNFSVEISAIRKVHYNAEAFLIHKAFLVGNDVWVPHGFKHVNLPG
jgi:hypothetical protein